MMADSKVLLALAHALNVKPDYFFRPFSVEINHVEFRKKNQTPCKNRQSYRFKQLIYRAASEEIISLSKAANLSNQKLTEFRKQFVAL